FNHHARGSGSEKSTVLATGKDRDGAERGHFHPVAKAMMTADIKEAIEQWEPRVTFISVDFMEDELNGRLIPMVEVEINP
ncbi:MAG: GPW/gp25 family protein, partial [Oscillospiraceae bacterium]|nr:GPW/gp25 family protein [Oscillospiraceae bacterium]